jgi:uncharacterized membrane protein (DUF373 family)
MSGGNSGCSRFISDSNTLVVMFLTALIAVIVIAAVWNLSLKILFGLVLSGSLDPSDYSVFQAVFGMILTVIIALEFKKSLLVVAERRDLHILAFATTILALGVVYWLVRDSDQRISEGASGYGATSPVVDVNR